jgi:hypothetical protein
MQVNGQLHALSDLLNRKQGGCHNNLKYGGEGQNPKTSATNLTPTIQPPNE